MLFDGTTHKCEVCGEKYDEFKKAWDCTWRDKNLLHTIRQLEKKYGEDVFNEMVKLWVKENSLI